MSIRHSKRRAYWHANGKGGGVRWHPRKGLKSRMTGHQHRHDDSENTAKSDQYHVTVADTNV